MEITIQYIVSQIFTIIAYALTTTTYHMSKRKKVLILNFFSKFSFAIAYVLLGAWSALAMIGVTLIRNIVFIVDENKNGKRDYISLKDVITLIVVYIITIIFGIYTYEGVLSLLPIFATLIYTYSIFQKDIKTYRLLGIPTELCCEIYNFYIKSVFAIIMGLMPLIGSIIGYFKEVKKEN